jgi:hypothetical protein
MLRVLSKGKMGADVKKWQYFLIGQECYHGFATGTFDQQTEDATKIFQENNHLTTDGIVGNQTFGAAMLSGYGVVVDEREGKLTPNFPKKPVFPPLTSNIARQNIFGKFRYEPKPVIGNPENIKILDNWVSDNIVMVEIPQLIPIKGSARVQFHKLGANQLKKLWQDWEDAGLLHLILTWGGSFVPRFIRGSRTTLSNHSFGSAFDINYKWNQLGKIPALVSEKGSVRELIEIANNNGFYWGGHFSRLDGMHFEIAKII